MRTYKFQIARTAVLAGAIISALVIGIGNQHDAVLAQRQAKVSVLINVDGDHRQQRTAASTVGATLREAGVEIGPKDVVTPGLKKWISDGEQITVVRVKEVLESKSELIAYGVVRTFSTSLSPGYVKQTRAGVRGEKVVHCKARYEDGVCISRKPISSIVTKRPVNQILAVGSRGRYTSRGEFVTRRTLRMVASAYDPGPRSCGRYATGRTACGLRAGYGVVAVDPRVIRLGSKLYIEGYGHAVAGDKGSAIKGNRIDLGFNTYREAIRFGRKVVTVHILEQ